MNLSGSCCGASGVHGRARPNKRVKPTVGYALGGLLTAVAVLVSTIDVCIPSLVYRSAFGFPPRRQAARELGA